MYDSMVLLLLWCECDVFVVCMCVVLCRDVCGLSVCFSVSLCLCVSSCLVLVRFSCSCLRLVWGFCLDCDTSVLSLGVFLLDSLIGVWFVVGRLWTGDCLLDVSDIVMLLMRGMFLTGLRECL